MRTLHDHTLSVARDTRKQFTPHRRHALLLCLLGWILSICARLNHPNRLHRITTRCTWEREKPVVKHRPGITTRNYD